MLTVKIGSAYKKDIQRAESRGWDIEGKLLPPLAILMNDEALPPQFKDHALKGEWVGRREFHADFDWIVIYKIVGEFLVLVRTGTHSDLFKK